jgi:hypothetical protein
MQLLNIGRIEEILPKSEQLPMRISRPATLLRYSLFDVKEFSKKGPKPQFHAHIPGLSKAV